MGPGKSGGVCQTYWHQGTLGCSLVHLREEAAGSRDSSACRKIWDFGTASFKIKTERRIPETRAIQLWSSFADAKTSISAITLTNQITQYGGISRCDSMR